MRVRGFGVLTFAIWIVVAIASVIAFTATDLTVALGIVGVAVTAGGVPWGALFVVFWTERSNDNLVRRFGPPPQQVKAPAPSPPPPPVAVYGSGRISATASLVVLPPPEDIRNDLRAERFLGEARFSDEESQRNAQTWLGAFRAQKPYLTAKLSGDLEQMLGGIRAEVAAEPFRRVREEVRRYFDRNEMAWPAVRRSPAESPPRKDSSVKPLEGQRPGTRAGPSSPVANSPPPRKAEPESEESSRGERGGSFPPQLRMPPEPATKGQTTGEVERKAGLLHVPKTKPMEPPTPGPDAKPKQAETSARGRRGQVCDPGPHEIEAGEFTELPLDVRKGERIKGRLIEEDGQDFDWVIVDEENSVAKRDGARFDSVLGEDHTAASRVNWRVPRDGPWYLILEIPYRQNPRSIRVGLARE